jgi:type IV pilus assembly protein PilV
MKTLNHSQNGVTLIEVLVSIVILSFGMLALGGMLAYAVQMPKLSGYRSTATAIAASHIERIRANSAGFANGDYQVDLSYSADFAITSLSDCTYPSCSTAALRATMDTAYTNRALRQELPAGGMRVTRANGGVSTVQGDMWIIWLEPTGAALLDAGKSDNCPSQVTGNSLLNNPMPRCLYIRFEI